MTGKTPLSIERFAVSEVNGTCVYLFDGREVYSEPADRCGFGWYGIVNRAQDAKHDLSDYIRSHEPQTFPVSALTSAFNECKRCRAALVKAGIDPEEAARLFFGEEGK